MPDTRNVEITDVLLRDGLQMESVTVATANKADLASGLLRAGVPIEVMTSRQNLRPMGQVGVPFPLHGGASAKVLLAWLEPQERQSLVMASHERDSSPRPFDFTGWERQLARTRKQGWAESDGERESGVSSIAAPIRDRVGAVVAAMVLSGPTTRLTERSVRTAAVQATVESAAWVSRAVGNVDVPASRRLA